MQTLEDFPDRLLTAAEVGEFLQVSPRWVLEAARRNAIPHIRLGRPQRRRTEKRPFDSWAQLDELAARLGPRHGPPVLFAAATGLRPGEWMALEQRDIDRQAGVA